jgi:predicted 2-oxoglutarate/Fe(II)-dependent dioxygenase YbiX
MYAGHLDLTQPLMWTVDLAMSETDCARYQSRMRQGAAEVAPVIGQHGVVVDPVVRSNTRVMWDDACEANELLARVAEQVPKRLRGQFLLGANPRLRLYRYEPGQHHSAHWDTVVHFAGGARSQLTLVFYLNDDFEGGETDFPELGKIVTPRRGSALLFQHRVVHTACPVRRGEKFVLRTDLVYGPPDFCGDLRLEDPLQRSAD